MTTADRTPCTPEHPNPEAYDSDHDREILRKMDGYEQWVCRNCGAMVTNAGYGV
jgi:hypothetical protein